MTQTPAGCTHPFRFRSHPSASYVHAYTVQWDALCSALTAGACNAIGLQWASECVCLNLCKSHLNSNASSTTTQQCSTQKQQCRWHSLVFANTCQQTCERKQKTCAVKHMCTLSAGMCMMHYFRTSHHFIHKKRPRGHVLSSAYAA